MLGRRASTATILNVVSPFGEISSILSIPLSKQKSIEIVNVLFESFHLMESNNTINVVALISVLSLVPFPFSAVSNPTRVDGNSL